MVDYGWPQKRTAFWDHTQKQYGPGAAGSSWHARSDFWHFTQPDGLRGNEDYAVMNRDGEIGDDDSYTADASSISQHDFLLSKQEILARLVEVAEFPPNPVLTVDFSKFQTTALRPLILTEDHISVDDIDTRDPLDASKVDASKITLRIMGLAGGTLKRLTGTPSAWVDVDLASTTQYREFSLADLQSGLIAFFPNVDASTLTFDIQADDGMHLSDSDPADGTQPAGVSIRVVALKEIDAGKKMPINDDRRATGENGALTPGDATLGNWIDTATSSLRVFVKLEGGKAGETLFLEDGHGITTIASSWSWSADTNIGILSLESDGSATVDDFQTVLNALALQTDRFASASSRTISVRPDIDVDVWQKDYYTRDLLVRASGPRPYVGVQQFFVLKFGQDDRAILLPSEFFLEDFDTSAFDITIVMQSLSAGAMLQKKDGNGSYHPVTPENDGSLEFTLEELQQGLMAIYSSDPLGKRIGFTFKAKDDDGHWNDVSKSNTVQEDGRLFAFDAVVKLAPEELEVNLQTGYQRVIFLWQSGTVD